MDKNERIKKLISEIRKSNQSAFIALMDLTRADLLKTAYIYLRDVMLAEDVVIEGYEVLLVSCQKLKNFDNIYGWLKTIVINKSLNLIKKRNKERPCEESLREKDGVTTDEIIENIHVRNCLAGLKEEERMVLLYKSNGFTLSDIAFIMNRSVKKVRILIEKAKNNFIKLYGEEN